MKNILISVIALSSLLLASNVEIVQNGEVLVNGKVLNEKTNIKQGDTIETKKGASFRFNIGKDAFLVNEKTKFSLKKEKETNVIDMVSGSIMGVFSKGKHEVKTPNMTAGIRGTGVYAMIRDSKTYFCTCYGETAVHGTQNKQDKVLSSHHHKMVWITEDKIKPTHNMESHNDDQLRALEKMVGRIPSFDRCSISGLSIGSSDFKYCLKEN